MKTLDFYKKSGSPPEIQRLENLAKELESLALSSKKQKEDENTTSTCRVASLEDLKNGSTIVHMSKDEEKIIFVDFKK